MKTHEQDEGIRSNVRMMVMASMKKEEEVLGGDVCREAKSQRVLRQLEEMRRAQEESEEKRKKEGKR